MKFGMRKPSIKRSISARTTGRAKRAVKRAIIPGYGRRGMGILHPKKALYNYCCPIKLGKSYFPSVTCCK